MMELVIRPLLAGLSMGLFCSAHCFPIVMPFLAAEERTLAASWRFLGWVLLGRCLGYGVFGLIVGLLARFGISEAADPFLHAALLLISVMMLLYGVGLLRSSEPVCAGGWIRFVRSPFWIGFLMGINICPPFLLSVIYVLTLHSVGRAIVYFLMFFLGTSVYFLPLGFLGLLGRWRDVRLAARWSAVGVGLIFGAYALYALIRRLAWVYGA